MKLFERVLLIAVVILVVHNLHGKVFPAKAMNGYEDSLAIMWEVLDADKDGGISVSELKAADADSDGSLSLDEVLDYTNKYIDDVEAEFQQEDINIEGTYEIYPPTFDEIPPSPTNAHDKFILELTKADDGEYSVIVTAHDQSLEGTEVAVMGNTCTFKTTYTTDSDSSIQTWKCTVNEGELSVEFSEMWVEPFRPITMKGKLIADAELQQHEPSIQGRYEIYSPSLHYDDQLENTILDLTKDDNGEYSIKLTKEDQSVNGTEVKVTGNKCTFKINVPSSDPKDVILAFECTVNDGELTVEYTQLDVETSPTLTFKGKLLVAE